MSVAACSGSQAVQGHSDENGGTRTGFLRDTRKRETLVRWAMTMREFESAEEAVLIFYLRPARNKARSAAVVEALSLLRDLEATVLPGGPLSEQGGLFWVNMPARLLPIARNRFTRLGYSQAVDLVQPVPQDHAGSGDEPQADERLTRWRRKLHRLIRLYEEDPESLRELAPDRRIFLFETAQGEIRPVKGYRGDGKALRRCLTFIETAGILQWRMVMKSRTRRLIQSNAPQPNPDRTDCATPTALSQRYHRCRVGAAPTFCRPE